MAGRLLVRRMRVIEIEDRHRLERETEDEYIRLMLEDE